MSNEIDPKQIKQADLPLIVFTYDLKSWFNFITIQRTKGTYGHVMTMTREGVYDSQMTDYFKTVPVNAYNSPTMRLKFVKPVFTDEQAKAFTKAVIADIVAFQKRPPMLRRIFGYDWLGCVGQFLGQKWVNNPWASYCSERVAKHFRAVWSDVPLHESPTGLNEWMKKFPERFPVYGYINAND